jgi:multicomponent Na+:H+ antiporter subunit E
VASNEGTEGLPETPPRTVRGVLILWAVLVVVWLAVNASFDPVNIFAGTAICFIVAFALPRSTALWSDVLWTPRAGYHFASYILVFAREIVRANINVLRYVYSPRIDISPGIVEVKTRLKSPIGRFVLANSIALTPGSLVIAIEGDTFYIHWLDVQTMDGEEATRTIVRPFEKHLEAIFG